MKPKPTMKDINWTPKVPIEDKDLLVKILPKVVKVGDLKVDLEKIFENMRKQGWGGIKKVK